MTNKQLKYAFLASITLLLVVIFFFTCRQQPVNERVITKTRIQEKEVIKQVGIDSADFQKQKSKSEQEIKKLGAKVAELKGDLSTAQGIVNELLNEAPVALTDTTKFMQQLAILKDANAAKDSLCNNTISGLEVINSQKDTLIAKHEAYETKLRQSFRELETISKAKDVNVSLWKKKYKKAKAGNTALKILAIAAGVVAVKQSL